MNLGDKLIELRKENKMSQEKFAEILGVTRQTISNWENYKNYPDISTIIKISDVFHISLDILLKGDTKMVSNMDKQIKDSKKYKSILVTLGIMFGIILILFGSYALHYHSVKKELEEKFEIALKNNNFKKNPEGYYSLKEGNGITYGVSNQKMPSLFDFSLDFHVKDLYCDVTFENGKYIEATWSDYNDYIFTIYSKDDIVLGSSSSLKEKDRNSIMKLSQELQIEEKELTSIIEKGNFLYKQFYK